MNSLCKWKISHKVVKVSTSVFCFATKILNLSLCHIKSWNFSCYTNEVLFFSCPLIEWLLKFWLVYKFEIKFLE